jgi:hypothetical protein
VAFRLSVAALVYLVEQLTGLAFLAVGLLLLQWRSERLLVGS